MDARNISRQTFIKTLNKFERENSSSITIINNLINDAANNLKFSIKITNDNIPNIKDIGYALEQYYLYRGYSVFFNNGDDKYGVYPYINIEWAFKDVAQPYEE